MWMNFLLVDLKKEILLTPHITWASLEARTLLMEKISQNIQEFIKEKESIIRQ